MDDQVAKTTRLGMSTASFLRVLCGGQADMSVHLAKCYLTVSPVTSETDGVVNVQHHAESECWSCNIRQVQKVWFCLG